MPLLRVQTNLDITNEISESFHLKLNELLMDKLNKPEGTVMILLEGNRDLRFAGTSESSAFIELKSIGLNSSYAEILSEHISSLVESELGINRKRIYIEFVASPGTMWGWNGQTFS